MSTTSDTIRVVIPLTMKRRNGRPRILPPEGIDAAVDGTARDPRLLRAIARAWDWRRRLDRGEVATIKVHRRRRGRHRRLRQPVPAAGLSVAGCPGTPADPPAALRSAAGPAGGDRVGAVG